MKHLVVIDGLSFLFRAYHAIRGKMTRERDGLPTNALYGFSQMLLKVVKDLQPDYCCVALDSIGDTFRKEIYPDYKAHRSEMDPEMKEQMPYFEPLIEAFGIPGVRVEGVEADDIIATLATEYGPSYKVTIVSSDKDLLQLLGGNVTMLDTMKNKVFDPAAVKEKFGVGPEKVIEVQALIGDSSDNIPGVPGVGPKTAAELVHQFEDLDGIYAGLDQIKREKLRENLKNHKKEAYLSKKLVTLKRDVPLSLDKKTLSFHPDLRGAREMLLSLDFRTLTARLPDGKQENSPPKTKGEAEAQKSESERKTDAREAQNYAKLRKKANPDVIDPSAYETVTTPDRLTHWLTLCERQKSFAFDTETTSLDAMRAELVGISLATGPGEACYIPLCHRPVADDMLGEAVAQLPAADVLKALKPLLEDEKITKIAHNLKYDLIIMLNAYEAQGDALRLVNFEDTMLMSACLAAGKHAHGLDLLALRHFGHAMIKFVDVAGRGQKQVTFDRVPLAAATAYAGEDADVTWRLYEVLTARLEDVA
jgi:DNA polymerase-1